MLLYSARKNSTNPIEENSVLYPETNSDSDSDKSNGIRLVSANIDIINNTNAGKSGNTKYISCCASTIVCRLVELVKRKTGLMSNPIDIS